MTDEVEWGEWFHQVLRELRLAYRRLTIDERAQTVRSSGMGDHHRPLPFSAPTQLIVVWVRDDQQRYDYQLVQIEHFVDRPNEEIAVYGPFTLEEYAERVAELLHDPRWSNESHHDHAFVEAVEDRLVTAYSYIPAAFGRESNTMNLSGQLYMRWYASDIAFASFRDIRRTEPVELVAELVKSTLGTSAPTTVARPRFRYNAIGTYSYRPFWVEQQPALTFAERLRGQHPKAEATKAWNVPFADTQILAWQSGFLAIEGKPDRTLERLNTFVSVLQLLGVPMDPVGTHAAIQIEVDVPTPA